MSGSRILSQAIAALALWAIAASFASAQDGRLSLADRVARLEQQQSNGAQQGAMDMLNRMTQMQTELQVLRGMLEEQQFRIDELERRNRDLAADFDSRIERLESGGAGASPPKTQDQDEPSASAEPRRGAVDRALEEPQVRAPVDAGLDARGLENPHGSRTEDSSAQAEPADPAAERAAYENAFDALKNGQYAESARRFQTFLSQFPDGAYAPNAQYWLGESYYVTQNYQIALDAFERLLNRFPDSNKAADALLKVGYCHYELRNWNEAEATLNRVVQRYPDSTVSRLAQGRLRALRLENRQ